MPSNPSTTARSVKSGRCASAWEDAVVTRDSLDWPASSLHCGEVELFVHDTGGALSAVMLLHGLGGHAAEWAEVARRLAGSHRVIAFDQRGHGRSTTAPGDVSRQAHVADVVGVLDHLGLHQVTLIGQSMGAHTALLVAAAHPDRVDRLVLIEGGVGGEGAQASDDVIDWFRSWPVPFADHAAAADHLGGGFTGQAWADGLIRTAEGLMPRFDPDVLHAAISAVHSCARWVEWETIACPVLLIKGEHGFLPTSEAAEMVHRNPGATLVEVPDAGHDVHLDAAAAVVEHLRRFIG